MINKITVLKNNKYAAPLTICMRTGWQKKKKKKKKRKKKQKKQKKKKKKQNTTSNF